MLVRLAIDYEHSSRTWWESGGRELWEGILDGFDESAVIVDESLARSWLAEAERIAGWSEGPAHAPHPIRIAPVGEGEDA